MKKMGRPPIIPVWLYNLEDGEYSLTQLTTISKTSKSYMCNMMRKYGAKKIVGRKVEKNMVRIRYVWSKKLLDLC